MAIYGYGTYIGAWEKSGAGLRSEIELVEAAGFDGIYFSEHHGSPQYPPSPLALAAYALGQSATLRSGPMPLLLPLHDTVRVAEETALLDRISDRRLVLGIATGYVRSEFEQADVPYERRGKLVDEALATMASLWRGETVPRDGELVDLAPLTHLPASEGGPPIWIAAASKPGMRRAVDWNAGLVLDSLRGPVEVEEIITQYRSYAAERGAEPGTVAVIRRLWLGTPEDVEDFLHHFETDLKSYQDNVAGGVTPWLQGLADEGFSREAIRNRVWAGGPEEVAEDLEDWCRSAGVDYVIVKFHWGRLEREKIAGQLELAKRFVARAAEAGR
jgi:alkanesulfonate monooxygenase SsuD/methylene tetrahydromethanopterin reductase-like flavin-dependent oxidoreductase (luciferase family)